MTLLITVFAAVTVTVLWYSRKNDDMRLGILCLMYWGASIMWLVDAIFEYVELRAEYFTPALEDMINDSFLGLAVVALLVLWLGGFLHSKSGKYIWDDYQVFGMTVELKIDGDTGNLTITADGKPQTQKCDVTFDSDRVVLSMNGKYLNCSYNRKKQTITIQ